MVGEKNKMVIITGAAGFLGREVVNQALMCQENTVIAISSQPKLLSDLYSNYSNFETVERLDSIDKERLDGNNSVLINCAFPRTSNPSELANSILYLEKTIKMAIDKGIFSIVNISSQSVYSQKSKKPALEETEVTPESFYAMTKFACERILTAICSTCNHDINYSNIRLASLSGIGLEERILNKFVKQALDGQPIVIEGGNQIISYLNVRDAASAIIAMINTKGFKWNTVYNLGNDDCCTLFELGKLTRKIAEEFIDNKLEIKINDNVSDFNNLVNSELFYRDFNWRPNYTIELMVRELFDYYMRIRGLALTKPVTETIRVITVSTTSATREITATTREIIAT